VSEPPRVRSIEEAEVVIATLARQVATLRSQMADTRQRLDTAQTNPLKRLWWWLVWGEPLTDWNADRPNWRPWNRARRHAPKGWL